MLRLNTFTALTCAPAGSTVVIAPMKPAVGLFTSQRVADTADGVNQRCQFKCSYSASLLDVGGALDDGATR